MERGEVVVQEHRGPAHIRSYHGIKQVNRTSYHSTVYRTGYISPAPELAPGPGRESRHQPVQGGGHHEAAHQEVSKREADDGDVGDLDRAQYVDFKREKKGF